MRPQPAPTFLRLLLLMLALVLGTSSAAIADDRAEARTHYQAGVNHYAAADYRSAIREFSAAQQRVPADLNNYNLALCYDKLGDADPAIQYYRAYLDKVPSTDKRPEIEASIARLDAAAKSVAAKKAAEVRKANEARTAEDARRAAADAKIAEAARAAEAARQAEELRKAEVARNADAARRPVDPVDPIGPIGPIGPDVVSPPVQGTGVGSTGTPGTGSVVSSGDEQIDRVAALDLDALRAQRIGGAGSGLAADVGGPGAIEGAAGAAGAAGARGAEDARGPAAATAPQGQGAPMAATDKAPKKAAPIYKKWWFWAVVAVSAYVVYQIASEDSQASQPFPGRPPPAPRRGG